MKSQTEKQILVGKFALEIARWSIWSPPLSSADRLRPRAEEKQVAQEATCGPALAIASPPVLPLAIHLTLHLTESGPFLRGKGRIQNFLISQWFCTSELKY